MNVSPIVQPFPGERISATWPTMRPDTSQARPRTDPQWRQRVRFWSGRSVTADALELGQENRAGNLAWISRSFTAGVVAGADAGLEPPASPPRLSIQDVAEAETWTPASASAAVLVGRLAGGGLRVAVFDASGAKVRDANDKQWVDRADALAQARAALEAIVDPDQPTAEERTRLLGALSLLIGYRLAHLGYSLHLLPGTGLTATGEDVVLPQALRIPLAEIPLRSAPMGFVPYAFVVVARPVESGRFDQLESSDPCELDPTADAFADERRQDAMMLELVPLPESLRTRPGLSEVDDPRWRNRLVHALLERETERVARQQLRFAADQPAGERWSAFLAQGEAEPWNDVGVALGLIGEELDAASGERRLFFDRTAVVRRGGVSKPRSRPAVRTGTSETPERFNPPGAGHSGTWRARIDQFAEQVASIGSDRGIAAIASHFQYLPPAGVLPREALTLLTTDEARAVNAPDRAATSHFFPGSYGVEAVPVAQEDLDAALAASAPLAPFDLTQEGDVVRLLVPVPQRHFDPRLLVIEQEDPIFLAEIGRLVAERQDWRQRRDWVRSRGDALVKAVKGVGLRRPLLVRLLENGQVEPEPTESPGKPDVAHALVSPGPGVVELTFPGNPTLQANETLALRVRVDEDAAPPVLKLVVTAEGFSHETTWDAPPPYPLERRDANGVPVSTALWRYFVVPQAELAIPDGAVLTQCTLHVISGRIALGEIVAANAASVPTPENVRVFWGAATGSRGAIRTLEGGEWLSLAGDALVAPFEDAYVPEFPDETTLESRLAELTTALQPAGATPAPGLTLTVETHGALRVIEELTAQADAADDLVDASFTRAQTNLYRIRKLVLGEAAAQKLLINPAIATIAEQQTASATEEKLASYLKSAKGTVVKSDQVNRALGGAQVRSAALVETEAPAAAAAADTAPKFRALVGEAKFVFNEPAFLAPKAPALETFNLKAKTDFAKFALKGDTLKDVLGQKPLAGPTLPPRGLSIGKRFEEPKATDNLAFARAALQRLVEELPRLRLPLVDETVYGTDREAAPIALLDLQGRAQPRDGKTTQQLQSDAKTALLKPPTVTADTDEAEVTLAALDYTETKSAILRTIEKAIQKQRRVIERGRETVQFIESTRALADTRVAALEPRLAEARHDVSVARSLRAEELIRLREINERRDAVLRDHVSFVAFVRPRYVQPTRRVLTHWKLSSPETPSTVPACLARHDEPPEELRAYLQLLRHAPARWFSTMAPRLKDLNTNEKLFRLLDAARLSAQALESVRLNQFVTRETSAASAALLQSAFTAMNRVRRDTVRLSAEMQVAALWADHWKLAEKHATLGDLMDGRHGDAALARFAADEWEHWESVSACLHAEFAGVAPAIRLSWIERYSQFDGPAALHDLSVLPGYARLDRATRRRFQALVDWLYGRIDRKEKDAVALTDNLVRVALLLASHAPVKQILAGQVPRPIPARPGLLIPLRPFDPGRVRVGMHFTVWRADVMVARGRVEDLAEQEVSARVDQVATGAAVTMLDSTMRVQFVTETFATKARA